MYSSSMVDFFVIDVKLIGQMGNVDNHQKVARCE